jgi:TolB-like protein/class 3 adenylate cyclase
MRTTRRLAAILAADVAGYSRLMAADEIGTLEALKSCRREIVDPAIAEHNGRMVKTTGDGLLVEFASAVDAVTCAMSVQEKMAKRTGEPHIVFRLGINVGDIIIDADDIFGDGVNVAARVENECEPGAVYLSDDAFRQVRGKLPFDFADLGERSLKNIDRPIRIYAATGKRTADVASFSGVTKPLPLPDRSSIAVLPFQNLSGDPEQEYFADGMVEDIITALSRFKSLFVIARNSSFFYKGKSADIRQVGRELGVRYVLEGSVRKAGSRLRITGQLIDAGTGAHLWAERFDGTLDDVFDLQDTLTEQVVSSIAPKLTQAEFERTRVKRPENLDAYDYVLKAQALMRPPTVSGLRAALVELYSALALAPSYAFANGLAAECYGSLDTIGDVSISEPVEAMRLARLAAEFGSDDPEALAAAAYAFTGFDSLETATVMLDRATKLNPNLARAWSLDGFAWLYLGDHARSLSSIHRALRLNPTDVRGPMLMGGIATIHFLRGEFDQAFHWAEKGLRESPTNMFSLRAMAMSAVKLGDRARATQAASKLVELYPKCLARIRKMMKRPEHADAIADALQLAGFRE